MANGPLGGFMPTPAAPAQPPQVKLDTTADSRGNFNNFLKNMNGALSVNPPVMAPVMGAMTPNMAPALSNIDIFNQPVSMMQDGGEVDDADADFADFSGTDTPSDTSDTNEGASSDNIDDSPPDSDMDYTDVFTSDELQDATDIGRATSGNDPTTIANQNVKFTDLNQNQIEEIKKSINDRNEKALAEDDSFFKQGVSTTAFDDELNKKNAADFQKVASGQVLPSEYLPTISDIFGTGEKEKSVMDAVDLTIPVADPFDITKFDVTRTPVFQDQIQRQALGMGIKPELTGTALDPFVSFDVGNQRRDIQRALEQGTLAENLDKAPTTFAGPPEITQEQRVQELLDRGAEAQKIKDRENRVQELLDRGTRAQDIVNIQKRLDEDTVAEDVAGSDKATVEKALSGGLGTSGLTKDDIKNIQDAADRDLIARSVQDKSRQFQPSTNVFGFNIPNVFGRGLNALSNVVDRQVMKDITEKGFTPVYDRSNNITGARDPNTGILMSGMDFSIQDRATSDNEPNQPLIRTLTPKQDEEKPDLPPNVIGGTGGQLGNLNNTGVIPEVASPFPSASSTINPISFDVGQLNKLIEMLTGVPARPVVSAKKGGVIGMANGGLIKAVDDFLAAS